MTPASTEPKKPSPACSPSVAAVLSLVVLVAVTAGGAGFWYGRTISLSPAQVPGAGGAEAIVQQVEGLLAREQGRLEDTRRETLAHLDALGGRLGQMQAELIRLNALGERLVRMADLSAEEFDFQNPPPMGGLEQGVGSRPTVEELTEEMQRLFSELQDRDRKLGLLEELIMQRDLRAQTMPAGSPVLSGYITSRFGPRKDPISGRRSFHQGVDFAGKRGSPVVAVADGLVIFSARRSGYGRVVEIRHGNGVVTRYAHNHELKVREGDLVRQGQTIATLGSSGRATGPHVHFEVLEDGKAVDPMKYVRIAQQDTED